MTYEEVISGLRALEENDFGDDVPSQLFQLTEALMELSQPERAVPELFAVVERFPDAELGTPGPLVHTLERLDYTEELASSLRRRPTPHGVWMVNRILNGTLPAERRQFYLDLLASIAHHPNATESARDQAEHFLEFQSTHASSETN
ncbi:hypothetical protein CfE428DRAFT_2901 [Chthoniobacter flavus Ellin428]|uniref:Immunity protein 30 domain-containing protein n=1 Tax=Chthoniobacter flavus Ellin428 TaxID=497964 RepID=B4D1W3_9BACT|nr:hypothetical protein [Chthoniobacter flavus]EDY19725.1 hypothetical protein CfE428DRAFT_2901 [Chthoniobacter flavus Ellin428]TCO92956.1 hypothetical protein EV701_105233 [Chthoniobacter flavus]